MVTKVIPNPLEDAWNPPEQISTNFGKVVVEGSTVMFVPDPQDPDKKMKIPYDPKVLLPDGSEPKPVTQVKISMIPVNPDLKFDVVRELLVFANEWTKITLPSIKLLGIMQLAELDGQYAEAEMVDTGRTWQKNGETKHGTTFKFLRLFATENECKAAAGVNGSAPAGAAPAPAAPPSGNGSERDTALKFLGAYVKNAMRAASHDVEKARAALAPMIAQQPILSKYFTSDSPEVTDLLVAESAPPF
jgi:hypothetical protein